MRHGGQVTDLNNIMTTTTKKSAHADKPAKKLAAHKPAAKHAAPKAHKAVEAKHEHVEKVEIAAAKTEPKEVKSVVKMTHGQSFYAVGKRKSAVSQILMTSGSGEITINKLPFEGYFQTEGLQHIVRQPLTSLGIEKQVNVKSKIQGGGIHAQAESLRHAISRAILKYNPESRVVLKKQGFLTRDPRVKERKKPGLKRARRAPQFSKR
jgi:small subunit ribosomal protein S9